MKKFTLLIAALMLLTVLTGCSPKEGMTVDSFTAYAESNGFSVQDVTGEYGKEGVTEAYLVATGENYELEYISFYDDDTARSGYYGISSGIDSNTSGQIKILSAETETTHYNSYYFTSEGTFYMVFRTKNTILCGAADEEFRSQMLDHAEAMGYK